MVGACNVKYKRCFFFPIDDPGEVGSSRERDRVKWVSDQDKDEKREKSKHKGFVALKKRCRGIL